MADETLQQRMARQRAAREARDGTPVEVEARERKARGEKSVADIEKRMKKMGRLVNQISKIHKEKTGKDIGVHGPVKPKNESLDEGRKPRAWKPRDPWKPDTPPDRDAQHKRAQKTVNKIRKHDPAHADEAQKEIDRMKNEGYKTSEDQERDVDTHIKRHEDAKSGGRKEYHAHLLKSWDESGKRNAAIKNHADKVEKMTDDEFVVHRKKLDDMGKRAEPDIARLAASLMKKKPAKDRDKNRGSLNHMPDNRTGKKERNHFESLEVAQRAVALIESKGSTLLASHGWQPGANKFGKHTVYSHPKHPKQIISHSSKSWSHTDLGGEGVVRSGTDHTSLAHHLKTFGKK